MFHQNPRGVPHSPRTYYRTFAKAITYTLAGAFNSSDVTTTQTFQELTQDKILRALRIKLETNYPVEDYPERQSLAYSIAKNFTLDMLRRTGSHARQISKEIISQFEEEVYEAKVQLWNRMFQSARSEFQALYPQYIESLASRYRPTQRKQIDTIRLLVFEGLGRAEVIEILEVPSLETLWQWRRRGLKRILAHPETSETLAKVLIYMKNSGLKKAETWPPLPDLQFFEDYDLGFPQI